MTALSDEHVNSLLSQWRKEYPFPGELLWGGYIELGGSAKDGYRMGQCNYYLYINHTTHERTPRSVIYLDHGMKNAPKFFQEATLWHEFAHGRAYNEDCKDNSHDSVWASYRRQKVGYWLGDIILKFIGVIWCH